jgi:hypothetical protein
MTPPPITSIFLSEATTTNTQIIYTYPNNRSTQHEFLYHDIGTLSVAGHDDCDDGLHEFSLGANGHW